MSATRRTAKRTNTEFLEELLLKYNGVLPYKVLNDYQNRDSKIVVEDKLGQYSIAAHALLDGVVPSLVNSVNKNTYLTNKYRNIYGEIYDYSGFNYISMHTKSNVICKRHGLFKVRPDIHLRGLGCLSCREEIREVEDNKLRIEKFRLKAESWYGKIYDYSLVNYIKNGKESVTIICSKHGEFQCIVDNFLKGNGCKFCNYENASSWDVLSWTKSANNSKHFKQFTIYFVRLFKDEESFYKIGRTYREISLRFQEISQYSYEVIHTASHDDPKIIFDLENHLKRTFKAHKYKPLKSFGGQHECFTFTPEQIESVKRQMTLTSASDIIPTSS